MIAFRRRLMSFAAVLRRYYAAPPLIYAASCYYFRQHTLCRRCCRLVSSRHECRRMRRCRMSICYFDNEWLCAMLLIRFFDTRYAAALLLLMILPRHSYAMPAMPCGAPCYAPAVERRRHYFARRSRRGVLIR